MSHPWDSPPARWDGPKPAPVRTAIPGGGTSALRRAITRLLSTTLAAAPETKDVHS